MAPGVACAPIRLAAGTRQFENVTSPQLVHGTSFLAAFSLIAYLHIVVGEMAPKSMALRRAEGIALWTAPPLYIYADRSDRTGDVSA